MNTSPVRLKPLAKLVEDGYDIAVLHSIQRSVLMQVLESRMLSGVTEHPANEVRAQAEALMPKDAHLESLYFERKAALRRAPLDDLKAAADSLALCADHLEQIAARALTLKESTGKQAQVEHLISKRYAQLILGAHTLEREGGIIPVHRQGELKKLSDPPEGPLSAFFTKAMAILKSHKEPVQAMPRRDRMTA